MKNACLLFIAVFIFISCNKEVKSIKLDTLNPLLPRISVPFLKKEKLKKEDVLRLYLMVEGKKAALPVYSFYSYSNEELSLIPASPLIPQGNFMVEWTSKGINNNNNENKITLTFQTPAFIPTDEPLVSIKEFYPVGSSIPENHFIFYALFTSPIEIKRDNLLYVDLINADGVKQSNVWTSFLLPARKNIQDYLPIMIHPGRVKQGINLGRKIRKTVIRKDEEYTVTINKEGFQDIFYRKLANSYQKTYKVTAPDYEIPYFLSQSSIVPKSPNDPLVLVFSESMDYFSIVNGIYIHPQNLPQEKIKVAVTHDKNDSRWKFIALWKKGVVYTVVITTRVSDLSHNNIRNRFEVTPDTVISNEPIYWSFQL